MERLSGVKQLLIGLIFTMISVGAVLGGFLLSYADMAQQPPSPTPVIDQRPSPTVLFPTLSPTPARTPTPPHAHTPTRPSPQTPTASNALIPACPPPAGWSAYEVQRGDTLVQLAWQAGIAKSALMRANCLDTPTLKVGQRIYLPPTPQASPTATPRCGPPGGWVFYTVQRGDTLYSLSRRVGVSIDVIRHANCMRDYTLYTGDVIYLPFTPPTFTPWPSPTTTPLPIPSPTHTLTPAATPTSSPMPTSGPTSTVTPTPSATITPTIAPPETPTSAVTSTPTDTPTASPQATWTVTAEATSTPTATPSPTATSISTATPTPTPTASPTP